MFKDDDETRAGDRGKYAASKKLLAPFSAAASEKNQPVVLNWSDAEDYKKWAKSKDHKRDMKKKSPFGPDKVK